MKITCRFDIFTAMYCVDVHEELMSSTITTEKKIILTACTAGGSMIPPLWNHIYNHKLPCFFLHYSLASSKTNSVSHMSTQCLPFLRPRPARGTAAVVAAPLLILVLAVASTVFLAEAGYHYWKCDLLYLLLRLWVSVFQTGTPYPRPIVKQKY